METPATPTPWAGRPQLVEVPQPACAHQPRDFRRRATSRPREIGRPNNAAAAANRPRASRIGRDVSGRRDPPSESPIDGTHVRRPDRQHELEHPLEPFADDGRVLDVVPRGQHQEVQIDIHARN